jgi:hypothetical protein
VLTQLDESLVNAASEWDDAIQSSGSKRPRSGRVSAKEPVVSHAGDETEAIARASPSAPPPSKQLQQAVADTRDLLEHEVVSELKEMQEVLRQRAATLLATDARRSARWCSQRPSPAWEQQLA